MDYKKKDKDAYKTIGEVAQEINLIDKKTGVPQTHTIRYWETQFKQLKPTIKAGGRRYYSEKNIKMLNFVKLLLKEKGLKIAGVKKILNVKADQSIDEHEYFDINTSKNKSTKFIKDKLKNISKLIKEIKNIKDG